MKFGSLISRRYKCCKNGSSKLRCDQDTAFFATGIIFKKNPIYIYVCVFILICIYICTQNNMQKTNPSRISFE